jgi:hypothetical protein
MRAISPALDGNPGNGKSTIASQFGRYHERRCRQRYPHELTPDGHEYLPVLYVNCDALPTIKGLIAIHGRNSPHVHTAERGAGARQKRKRMGSPHPANGHRPGRPSTPRATNGLIDYAQRRKKLASWTGIDPETWSALLPYARPGTTHIEHLPDRAHAAVWLWCKLTGGYALAAPITHTTTSRSTQPSSTASRQSYATGC